MDTDTGKLSVRLEWFELSADREFAEKVCYFSTEPTHLVIDHPVFKYDIFFSSGFANTRKGRVGLQSPPCG